MTIPAERQTLSKAVRDALANPQSPFYDPGRARAGAALTRQVWDTPDDLERLVQGVLDKIAATPEAATPPVAAEGTPAVAGAQALLWSDVDENAADESHPRNLLGVVSLAYCRMFNRLPEDHVVIDDVANAEFIARCRDLGADVPEYELNKTLLNARKSRKHSGLTRTPTPPMPRDVLDRIAAAAEISGRLVQLHTAADTGTAPSIDRILCQPTLRRRFDCYSQVLGPIESPYAYRLALLAFRKSGRWSGRALDMDLPEVSFIQPFEQIAPQSVAPLPGLYRVLCQSRCVFMSWTLNLRERIVFHTQFGGGRLVPDEIGLDVSYRHLRLEVRSFPDSWSTTAIARIGYQRKYAERPVLNLLADAS